MTPQEAIEIIKDPNRHYRAKADGAYEYTEFVEALETAKQALEKQIPKKPTDICTPVVTWGLCPICKGELNKLGGRANRVFVSNAFCPDCGQALDWSDV